MEEPNEHKRLVEQLNRAPQPEREPSPQLREEMLQRLVRKAVPEVVAPDSLRQRVQALAATTQLRRRPWWSGIFTMRSWTRPSAARLSVSRRQVLAAGVATVVATSLGIFLHGNASPAATLDEALSAMARVRSAHCTGWLTSYRRLGADGQPIPERRRVEWWYKAPERYRKDVWTETTDPQSVRDVLVITGAGNATVNQPDTPSERNLRFRHASLDELPPSLDFFKNDGIIVRARRAGAVTVVSHAGRENERAVDRVELGFPAPATEGRGRYRWQMTIDSATARILHSSVRTDERQASGTWVTVDQEDLEDFDYDVTVPDAVFRDESNLNVAP